MPNQVVNQTMGAVLSVLLFVPVWGAVWPMAAWAAKAAAVPKVSAPPTPPQQGNPVLGREKIDSERCQECHGIDGQGAGHGNGPEGKFAKLAGQDAAYLLKQMRDFRSGARKHDQMAIMARSVSDEDVRDISAYFASLPVMKGEPDPKAATASAIGQRLYEQGDATRGVLACASCHSPQAKGAALAPRIAGQEWRYLDKQLRDWRSGDRKNSPDGVMNKALSPLSDAEIEALATHLASQ